MPEPEPSGFPPSRFAQISTHRDLLGNADALLERYSQAIRSYLWTVLRDEDGVQDVLLALRIKILDGRFARWAPGRGKFRSYLKQAVLNEALQYLRKQRNRRREQRVEDLTRFPEGRPAGEAPHVWLNLYRSAVLEAAMKSLRSYQDQHPGNVFHSLLTLLAGGLIDAPGGATLELSDAELAAQLSRSTGRASTVANLAQQKRRARHKFAELLAQEVRLTLEQPTPEDLEDELRHLGLLGYLGDFLPPDLRAPSDRAEPDD
jgi:DNA-directed RNA polymerase specialized sigma24 family protein